MSYYSFVIGRNPIPSQGDIPIVLNDSSKVVSSQHCRIIYDNGNFFIEDLGSKNKTYVDGSFVTGRTPIHHSSRITFGKSFPFSLNHPQIQAHISSKKPGTDIPVSRIEYASWGARLGGYLLDGIFFSFFLIPLYAVYFFLIEAAQETGEVSMIVIGLIIILIGIIIAIHFYFAVQVNRTGQTWGKKILNIKVLDSSSYKYPSQAQSWGRYLAYNISGLILFVGFFMPFWTKKKQALHDMMAGTIVVKAY